MKMIYVSYGPTNSFFRCETLKQNKDLVAIHFLDLLFELTRFGPEKTMIFPWFFLEAKSVMSLVSV